MFHSQMLILWECQLDLFFWPLGLNMLVFAELNNRWDGIEAMDRRLGDSKQNFTFVCCLHESWSLSKLKSSCRFYARSNVG